MIELRHKNGITRRTFAPLALPSGQQDYWISVALHDARSKLVEKIEVEAPKSEEYEEAYKKAIASHAQLRAHVIKEAKEKRLFVPSLENDFFAPAVDDWETYRRICRPEEFQKVEFLRNAISADIARKLMRTLSAFEEDTKKLEEKLSAELIKISDQNYKTVVDYIRASKSEEDLAKGYSIGIVLKEEDPNDEDIRGKLTQLGTIKHAQFYIDEKKKIMHGQVRHIFPHKESAVSEGQHLVEFIVNLYRAYGHPIFQEAVSIMNMENSNPSIFSRGLTAIFAKPKGYPLKRQNDIDYPFFAEGISVNVPEIGQMPVMLPRVELDNREHPLLDEKGVPYSKDKEEFVATLEREIQEARNSRKKGFYIDRLKEEYGIQ